MVTPDADALGDAGITVASFNVLNYFTTLDKNGNKTETLNGTLHNPRGADNPRNLLGDLNAYAMENPITTLQKAGFELLNDDYSYVFDGFWGSLDHALASESLAGQVTGTTTWHINADETSPLDYNTDFTNDRQDDNLFAEDAFRSSDHDPILVGLTLTSAEF